MPEAQETLQGLLASLARYVTIWPKLRHALLTAGTDGFKRTSDALTGVILDKHLGGPCLWCEESGRPPVIENRAWRSLFVLPMESGADVEGAMQCFLSLSHLIGQATWCFHGVQVKTEWEKDGAKQSVSGPSGSARGWLINLYNTIPWSERTYEATDLVYRLQWLNVSIWEASRITLETWRVRSKPSRIMKPDDALSPNYVAMGDLSIKSDQSKKIFESGLLADLLNWAQTTLKGNERLLIERLIEHDGAVPLADFATEESVAWEVPWDSPFNSLRMRVNNKLRRQKKPFNVERHDNEARLVNVNRK